MELSRNPQSKEQRFENLESMYLTIFRDIEKYLTQNGQGGDRAAFLQNFEQHSHPHILKAMLDLQDYKTLIWQQIDPESVEIVETWKEGKLVKLEFNGVEQPLPPEND